MIQKDHYPRGITKINTIEYIYEIPIINCRKKGRQLTFPEDLFPFQQGIVCKLNAVEFYNPDSSPE